MGAFNHQPMAKRSQGLFPNIASTDDDAGLLATSFQPIVGLGSAGTAQLNIVATLSADTDEVLVQVQKGGSTKNLTYGWDDFRGEGLGASFLAPTALRHTPEAMASPPLA
jgi:hypothetical protein